MQVGEVGVAEMRGKKLMLARFLSSTRLLSVFRHLGGQRLIVFNYHRIRPDERSFVPVFDDEVYGPSAGQFRQHMVWLKRNTQILSENELIGKLSFGGAFSTPSVLITFDDGYRDNYERAYPILKELEIPALFFIPSGQIATRELGWWDVIAYLVKLTRRPSIRFEGAEVPVVNKAAAVRFFLGKMKREPCEKTADLLSRLSVACDVQLPDRELQSAELMTWDHIRELARAGMAVGSHTNSHRVLATLPISLQEVELRLSKEIIERELGGKVRSVSYPVGNYEHFSGDTQAIASRCGYDLGFSFNTGVNWGNRLSPFDVKRVDPRDEIELISAMSLLPRAFAR